MARTFHDTVGGTTNNGCVVHVPRWTPAVRRAVLCFHGHGGSEWQIQQGESWAGHPEYWCDRGYVVIGVSTGDHWDDTTAMAAGLDAYNYLVAKGWIAAGDRVGVAGWSMGGGHAFRWLLDNPAKVAVGVTFSPDTDLDWSEQQSAWATEIDALYGGSHAGYLTNGSPRSPRNNAAAYRGGARMLVIHPTDDATLPYTMNAGGTGFVALVNDASVTLRQPDIVGGHQGGLLNVTPRETWEWLRSRWAA